MNLSFPAIARLSPWQICRALLPVVGHNSMKFKSSKPMLIADDLHWAETNSIRGWLSMASCRKATCPRLKNVSLKNRLVVVPYNEIGITEAASAALRSPLKLVTPNG